jgi:RNA polymerase sigma-70 factor (ECF subfamily)
MSEPKIQELSIEALRAGDRDEFARLVDAYSGPIYRLGLRMLGREQDAEDVLQNTFVKVLQNIRGFEERSSLSTWIYRIAANEALMMLRKMRPEVNLDEQGSEEDEDLTPTQFADWSPLPEDALMSGESKKFLERAIKNLPESLRVVFILRDIEGLSIRETSETLNLTETNVKTRLLRARLNLREQLSIYYGEHFSKELKK